MLNHNLHWYYYWVKLIKDYPGSGSERWSSHYDKSRLCMEKFKLPFNRNSTELEFEIYFPWNGPRMNWGCLLFGRYMTKNEQGVYIPQNKTWFQTEAHAATRPGVLGWMDEKVHVADAVEYFATGKSMNVGPRGFSSYTESNPLVLKKSCPLPPKRGRVTDLEIENLWEGMDGRVDEGATREAARLARGEGCAICDEKHGLMPSVKNKWHYCKKCRRVFCPKCGADLKGKQGFFDPTRRCICKRGRTTLAFFYS